MASLMNMCYGLLSRPLISTTMAKFPKRSCAKCYNVQISPRCGRLMCVKKWQKKSSNSSEMALIVSTLKSGCL
eukprot:symbB.v1.2.032463.t1/scaffold3901.1/size48581/4